MDTPGKPQDFNPLPPRGGRPAKTAEQQACRYFNPLPPRGGRPTVYVMEFEFRFISIHSLLAEGDIYQCYPLGATSNFNPLPPRGGRLKTPEQREGILRISIHSLLAEGDAHGLAHVNQPFVISIHSLLAEGDLPDASPLHWVKGFQSTPSSRRETIAARKARGLSQFQSTPSSRRETKLTTDDCYTPEFQSTPSSRRETPRRRFVLPARHDFNPLPPRGGRRSTQAPDRAPSRYFNPLPPRGGRRPTTHLRNLFHPISIHSLLAEGDGSSRTRTQYKI